MELSLSRRSVNPSGSKGIVLVKGTRRGAGAGIPGSQVVGGEGGGRVDSRGILKKKKTP